jgi:tripartite-type tricarboxylate transporter receptor subunit TctC
MAPMKTQVRCRASWESKRIAYGLKAGVFVSCFAVFGGTTYAYGSEADRSKPRNFPSKPIRVLVGASAGGGTDLVARLIGRKLADNWGTTVVIDNRAGGAGVVAMNILAQAPADGHTISIAGNSLILAGAQGKAASDIRSTIDGVVQLTSQPYLLVVNPALPIKSVSDLVALAKSRAGSLNYGSSGTGSPIHLGTELLCALAGIKAAHIPYKGIGPALIDAMTGQIHFLLSNGIAAAPHLNGGKLKAVAVTTLTRTSFFPHLPTIAESGIPGYEHNNMYAVYAPVAVNPAILKAFNGEFSRIVNSQAIREKLAADGAEAAAPMAQGAFRALYLREIGKWQRFIRESRLTLE